MRFLRTLVVTDQHINAHLCVREYGGNGNVAFGVAPADEYS